MTTNEINDTLSAIRAMGHDFNAACDRLANMVNGMAKANDNLLDIIRDKDGVIEEKNSRIAALNKDNSEVYERATRSEHRAYDLDQSNIRLVREVEVLEANTKSMGETMRAMGAELDDLRPFRDQVVSLQSQLADRNRELASKADEINRLLEVILNVATSVDRVMNPPKPTPIEAPKDYPDTHSTEGYAHPQAFGHQSF